MGAHISRVSAQRRNRYAHFLMCLWCHTEVCNIDMVTGNENCLEIGTLDMDEHFHFTLKEKAHPRSILYLRNISEHVLHFIWQMRTPKDEYRTKMREPFNVADVSLLYLHTIRVAFCNIFVFVQKSNVGERILLYANPKTKNNGDPYVTDLNIAIGSTSHSIWQNTTIAEQLRDALRVRLDSAKAWQSNWVQHLEKILKGSYEDESQVALALWYSTIGP